MRILQWRAERFKRIEVVDITPNAGVNRVTGDNGSGKSSNLDGIYALFGGKDVSPTTPVHLGEESAELEAKIGDETVKYIVKRTYSAETGKTTLTVSTPEGAKFGGGQGLIDNLVNIHAFDPLGFTRLDAKKQVDALLRMLGLNEPLAAIDSANKSDYDNRTAVNRRVKELKAQIDAIPVGETVEPVDVAAVMQQITAVEADNQRNARMRASELSRQADILQRHDRAMNLREKAAALVLEAEDIESRLKDDLRITPPIASDDTDVQPLRQQILDAQAINAEVNRQKTRALLVEGLEDVQGEADVLTANIDARVASKALLLKDAAMPLPELTVTDDCVMYKGVPLKDGASQAEEVEVSAAIAMAMNPTLKVIFLREASLMSPNTRQRVFDFALARGYQVWSEEVDVSGEVGFYMVDGRVAAIDGVPVVENSPA